MVDQLVIWWYGWGVFLGTLLALAAIGWIFYQERAQLGIWHALGVVGLILIVPSLFNKIRYPDFLQLFVNTIDPSARLWGLVGIAGAVLALIALGWFLATRSTRSRASAPFTYSIPPTMPVSQSQSTVPAFTPGPTVPVPQAAAPVADPPLPKTQIQGTSTPALAWVAVEQGSNRGVQTSLRQDQPLSIGRDGQKCELVLDDPSLSSQHALIRYEQGRFCLYDMASTNGTFVNGTRIQRQSLMDGDRIRLGGVTLIFKEASRTGRRS